MGKKKGWFTSFVRRLFNDTDSKPKSQERSSKKWRWFLGKYRLKRHHHHHHQALQAPPPQRTILNEATEEQRKHAMTVAIATAAAADVAVTAAYAAVAEVVRLTHSRPFEVGSRSIHHLAAIKIQSSYRGYLARKALSALKGIVRFQALVRGELVRRRVIRTLSSLSLLANVETLAHHRRSPVMRFNDSEKRRVFIEHKEFKHEEFKLPLELNLGKHEVAAKRECTKRDSFSYRDRRFDPHSSKSSDESIMALKETRKSMTYDREHKEKTENLNRFSRTNTISVDTSGLAQLRLRATKKHETGEDSNSPFSRRRKSFSHIKKKSIEEYGFMPPDSPVLPQYMASTESAKAKSLSTPRQRMKLFETYSSHQHSPYKLSISNWSSFDGEVNKW